ncbi:MAG TPA: cytochrome c biogenesis protein DipZ [Solirubrobacteraceae bacterium]|nr:cytochrome c biogenesis protein DipZ [Solirubrobacteraceae bacterium]
MLVLLAFALLAGAGTAVSPCVVPVLPALLSAGATGGRRRPVGVVVGLVATFVVTVVGLATALDELGLGDDILRVVAIVVLVAFGAILLAPRLADRLEAPLSRLARFGPRTRGRGFWSGLGVGAALGFVYAPCAGPILAAVISVSATRGVTAGVVAVAIAYGVGSGVVLLALALGGRRLSDRVRRAGRGPALQRATGVVLLATAALMAFNLDIRFESYLAANAPSFLTDPATGLEKSGAVSRRLADLRGGRNGFGESVADARPMSRLRHLGVAPDFTGTQRWFNTPGGRPLSLSALRGRVVLVDFWTYTCIDCLRTFPELRSLDAHYRRDGLTIVGVHTPEFAFEKNPANVAEAIAVNHLRYPVVQDNDYGTWQAYGNEYWPAQYLIDAQGNVRYVHFGEGGAAATEDAIRSLLAERGARLGPRMAPPRVQGPADQTSTPESYLGTERADRFVPRTPVFGVRTYAPPGRVPLHHLALGGTWRVGLESATAVRGATLLLRYHARDVYLVLSARPGARSQRLDGSLDGRPLALVTVTNQRLYTVVAQPRAGDHLLRLHLPPGLSAYDFTFG